MNLQHLLLELGPEIEKQGLVYDAENKFAEKNFSLLKQKGVWETTNWTNKIMTVSVSNFFRVHPWFQNNSPLISFHPAFITLIRFKT